MQRGMSRTFELYNDNANNLGGQRIQIAGVVPDTHKIHEIQIEYIFSADSSLTTQSSVLFPTLAAQDNFINAFFGGSTAQDIQIQSPDLGELVDQQYTAAQLMRVIAAAAEVYAECPLLAQWGGAGNNPNKVVTLPTLTQGRIEDMRLLLRIPFAYFNREDIRDTFCPFAGQFQSGGIRISPPATTFSDGPNTWTFDVARPTQVRVLAVCRPGGVQAGKASPIRYVKQVSSTQVTQLTNDMTGLLLHFTTLGNNALGLEQAGAAGRYKLTVDGLEVQSKNDSSATWAKQLWYDGLAKKDAFVARNVPMTGSSYAVGVGVNDGRTIDVTATRDVPLVSFGEDNSLAADSTIAVRDVTVMLNEQWLVQTPSVEFCGVVVWQRNRINGSSAVCRCADGRTSVDATGQLIAPPSGRVSPDLVPFLPAYQPIQGG